MNSLIRVIRNTLLVVGLCLIYGGVSTHDFYSMELHEPVPADVWTSVVWGFVFLIPTFIHLLIRIHKERDDVDDVQDG